MYVHILFKSRKGLAIVSDCNRVSDVIYLFSTTCIITPQLVKVPSGFMKHTIHVCTFTCTFHLDKALHMYTVKMYMYIPSYRTFRLL